MSLHNDHDIQEGFRALSDLERELLSVLLGTDFAGRGALVKQLASASAREIDDNGSLEFMSSDTTIAEVARRVPVEAELDDRDGATIHVLLHVVNGRMKELEIYRDDLEKIHRSLAARDLRLIIL